MLNPNGAPGQQDMSELRMELSLAIGFPPQFGRPVPAYDPARLEQLCTMIVDQDGNHPYEAHPNADGGVSILQGRFNQSNPGNTRMYHFDARGVLNQTEAWHVGPHNHRAYPDPATGHSRPIDHYVQRYEIDADSQLQYRETSVHFVDQPSGDEIVATQTRAQWEAEQRPPTGTR